MSVLRLCSVAVTLVLVACVEMARVPNSAQTGPNPQLPPPNPSLRISSAVITATVLWQTSARPESRRQCR